MSARAMKPEDGGERLHNWTDDELSWAITEYDGDAPSWIAALKFEASLRVNWSM